MPIGSRRGPGGDRYIAKDGDGVVFERGRTVAEASLQRGPCVLDRALLEWVKRERTEDVLSGRCGLKSGAQLSRATRRGRENEDGAGDACGHGATVGAGSSVGVGVAPDGAKTVPHEPATVVPAGEPRATRTRPRS